ncbi:MAG TPA: ribose-phosphate diphosphokinase, partial [Candidatus Altiarchaeales archaeon]|nr:ribose-phosphate diphosphokinase [Candidatus Altiarchaeales archaeon]
VFGGTSSGKLASKVAEMGSFDLGKTEIRKFPDGEFYIRILSDVEDQDCVLIQTTRTSDDLIELFLLSDLLRDLNSSEIHTVIPYLAYSRQDKVFKEGEALSAKTILQLIDKFSDSITTVNCHFFDFEGEFEFYGVRLKNLDAFPLLVEYFNGKLENPVIISPDKGALECGKKAAEIMKCEFDCLEKERVSDDKVIMTVGTLDISNRDVILIDDMISTGGTILEAARILRKEGADTISAGCVHGVFSYGTAELSKILDNLVCTDTIQTEVSKVSIAPLIAENLNREN